ncbi:MAG: UDP-N-acetylglucosamine 1-carboxyvinyltransferase [Pseudobdellovibrionaceae bacterium]|nr:MAG: UDP-N-acetylglucosamine 1-carboxyvinyltransferase [Pseudobdellovibrionaceae bacterium]
MDAMLVEGGHVLNGEIATSGSKNAALPILFSSLLADGEHVFHNVPRLKDIDSTCQLLELLGCETHRDGHTVKIKVSPLTSYEAHYDIVRKMRASILCLGPLLARHGRAKVSLPGGCAIGTRPINLHLEAMKALGAEIEMAQGYVYGSCKRLVGNTLLFDAATVGGTENLLMAASLAEGRTIVENAAKEPEVVDLANYLNKMGAKISGAGSSIITIDGVERLTPAEHPIVADRIEAGTLLIAGAITGGEVTVTECEPDHFHALTEKLRESGFKISVQGNAVTVHRCNQWRGVDVTTAPHPGFPTDLQAQFMALMTQAEGTSVITETVFENRFMHVQELVRLNADINPKSRVAVVRGRRGGLKGAPVMATDLRASACLVLAGLVAEGQTQVNRIYHLDRGYEALEQKLTALGGVVKRVKGD